MKIILSILVFITAIQVDTQSIFKQNFETSTTLLTSGWTLYNEGNVTANGYDSFFLNTWEIEEMPNLAASTISIFLDTVPADRWLITPSIIILTNAKYYFNF